MMCIDKQPSNSTFEIMQAVIAVTRHDVYWQTTEQ